MRKKQWILLSIVVIGLGFMLSLNVMNHSTLDQQNTAQGPTDNVLLLLNDNCTLNAVTNASLYSPTQIIHVWTNFTFENGTAIDGAVIGFALQGPNNEPLQTKANLSDSNGIATQDFRIQEDYYDGNYSMYVTATKGVNNASKVIFIYVNSSNVQITMRPTYLTGDIIKITALYRLWNGTLIDNALCSFIMRNSSGPLQTKANFTDNNGISTQSFGTTNYLEGYYEMYVTATKGNYTSTANQTFYISEYSGPVIGDPSITPDPPAFNQSALVNVSIGVPPSYATITDAKLSFFNGTGWYNLSMTNSTPIDNGGYAYYNTSIPPHAWGVQISYKIWAMDSQGNQTWNDNGGAYFNYTVTDHWGPTIEDPAWTSPPITYNQTVYVEVHLLEDPKASGINTVLVYWYNGISWLPIPMAQVNGSAFDAYYNATIPSTSYGITVQFYIWANDSAGAASINDNAGGNYSYFVNDFWGPTISSIEVTNIPVTYNMTANVTCQVTEPTSPANAAGVDSVILIYYNGSTWINSTMSLKSGDAYNGNYSVLLPYLPYCTTVQYWIWVNDSAGNPTFNDNSSNYYSYHVEDLWGPTLLNPSYINPPTTYNNTANITIDVQEPIFPALSSGVNTVLLVYWNGTHWNNLTMTLLNGDAYNGIYQTLIPELPYGTVVKAWFWANDTAGNPSFDDNNGQFYNYTVTDLYGPSISEVTLQNPPITYADQANITVRVQEPTTPANAAGVDTVLLYYYDTIQWYNLSMTLLSGDNYDGYYFAFIPEQNYGNLIQYYIWANDTANNTNIDDNSSSFYTYFVEDFTSPNISEILVQNSPIAYNMTANISCRVQEPTIPALASGVNTVILSYHNGVIWNNITMSLTSGNLFDGYYSAFIPTLPYCTTVQYWIWANDSAGNLNFDDNASSYYFYHVDDFWGPNITNPNLINPPITYNETANVTINIEEPTIPTNAAGVDTVILVYWNGTHWNNLTMSLLSGDVYNGTYQVLVPELPYGTEVAAWFWANDTAGNPSFDNNGGALYNYTVTDLWPPSISNIQTNITGNPSSYEIIYINVTLTEPLTPTAAAGVALGILSFQNASGWFNTSMNLVSGDNYNGIWEGYIPGQPDNTFVNYTIYAADFAGFWSQSPIKSYIVKDTLYTLHLNVTTIQPDEKLFIVGTFMFKNGTIIPNALCNFIVRNASGPLQNKAAFTNSSGMANITFGFGDFYTDGIYEISSSASSSPYFNNATAPFTIQRYIRPEIENPTFTPTPPGYNQSCIVNASILVAPEAGFVDTAILYWLHPSLGWRNVLMTNTSYDPLTGIGYYNASIPTFAYGIEIATYIWANDTGGAIGINNNSNSYHNYTITDYWGPTIENPVYTSPPITYNMTVPITVHIIEDVNASGTDTPLLYYFDGITWQVLTMGQINGTAFNGYFSAQIPETAYGITVQFYIWCNDTAGNPSINNNAGANYSYTITDLWAPSIGNPSQNDTVIEYTESVNITVQVMEPTVPINASGVQTVILSYWNSLTWTNITMNQVNGTIYSAFYSAVIPNYTYGTTIAYMIFARDVAGNEGLNNNANNYFNYTIVDITDPTIYDPIENDTIIEYFEDINITVQITEPLDASGVSLVTLSYWTGSNWINVSMPLVSGTPFDGQYSGVIPHQDYGTEVAYQIFARDVAGNEALNDNSGNYFNYTVTDQQDPHISILSYFPTREFNETQIVNASISETYTDTLPAGVMQAQCFYWNGTQWLYDFMGLIQGDQYNGVWQAVLPSISYGVQGSFYIIARDYAFNIAINDSTGHYFNYTITDSVTPIINDPTYDNPLTYNEFCNVSTQITELPGSGNQSGVDTVILYYWTGLNWMNTEMNRISGDQFNGTYGVSIPAQPYGTHSLYVWANDTVGNSNFNDNNGNYFNFTVIDLIAPTIGNPVQNDSVIEYTDNVKIDVQVTEPLLASGVATVILSYHNGSVWINSTMSHQNGTIYDGYWSAIIPQQPYGVTISYQIFARDFADNEALNNNIGSYFNYSITDITAPSIQFISPSNGTTITGDYPFTIEDILPADSDIANLTIIYSYNTSGWLTYGTFVEGINMSWNVGWRTIFTINTTRFPIGSNYTFSATAYDLRGYISAPTYIYDIIVSNYTGPFVYNIYNTPDPPAYNESASVYCTVLVPEVFGDISSVILHYNNGTGWYQVPMNNITPLLKGKAVIFNASIPAFDWATHINYWIFANDTMGNSTNADNSGSYFGYTIVDHWAPIIEVLNYSASREFNETQIITSKVTDLYTDKESSGVKTVRCYYWNGTQWTSVIMTLYEGGQFDGNYSTILPALSYGVQGSFYIWAEDEQGNTAIANNNSNFWNYTITDSISPIIYAPSYTNPVTYYELINVTVRVTEPHGSGNQSGVDTVICYYWTGTNLEYLTMNRQSGNEFDGIYGCSIPYQTSYNTHFFYIWANDTVNNIAQNNNNGNNYSIDVFDDVGPVISEINIINTPITYNMTANVTCRISEPALARGVSSARIIYDNGSGPVNVQLVRFAGNDYDGYYYYLIPSMDYGTTVQFYIWATDKVFNPTTDDNNSNYYSYTVEDFWASKISEVMIVNAPIAYNMTSNVTCHVQEPTTPANAAGVNTVILSFFNGTAWTNSSMSLYAGNSHDGYYSASIPKLDYGITVLYMIYTTDNAGNPTHDNNSGAAYSYIVDDFWGPSISEVTLQNPPITYNIQANITCRIREPNSPTAASGVNTVILSYYDGNVWNNLSMIRYSGDLYDGYYEALIPESDYSTTVQYWIWTNDSVGNSNSDDLQGSYYSYIVNDLQAPSISFITDNTPVTYDMNANISCRIQDPTGPADSAGVDVVLLSYHNGTSWLNLTMSRYNGNNYDGYYSALIPKLDYGTTVQYWIWAADAAGNSNFDDNSGTYYQFTITDLLGPTLSEISLLNGPITYNLTANLSCRIQEPTAPTSASGVDTAILSYYNGTGWNNITLTRYLGTAFDGFYSVLIPELDYCTTVLYWVWVNDTAGNPSFDNNSGLFYSYHVEDFWAPSLLEIELHNAPITYNESANITCHVQEPTTPANSAGVSNILLSYNNGTHWTNLTMNLLSGDAYDGYYSVLIPAHAYCTTIHYWIYATDSAGNSIFDDNSSNYYSYHVDDLWAPNIGTPVANDTIVEYTEAVTIVVNVVEPRSPADASGIQLVTLSYWVESSWTNITMIQLNGTIYNGFWTAVIPKQPYGVEIAYKIYAKDWAGNEVINDNSGSFYNYTITDVTPPTCNLISPVDTSSLTGYYPFEIEDIDPQDIDVYNLTVVYSYNTSGWIVYGYYINGTNLTWNVGATTIVYVNTSTLTEGSNYTFYVIAEDLRGLVSTPSYIYNITIANYVGPIIYNISRTPKPTAYNETATISCEVQVLAGFGFIDVVQLHYWNGTAWNVVEMYNTSSKGVPGSTVTHKAAIPAFNWSTQVSYWIWANDTNGLNTTADNKGQYYNYTITDKWAPTIGSPSFSPTREFNETQNVQVQVSEFYSGTSPSTVQEVRCYYWNGFTWDMAVMNRIAGNEYDGTYNVTLPALSYGIQGSFYIWARDYQGNVKLNDNTGNLWNYTITDSVNPVIYDPTFESSAPYYEQIDISIRITELPGSGNQSGVVTVRCYYLNGSVWGYTTISRVSGTQFDGIYNGSLPFLAYGPHSLYITATDAASNLETNDNSSNYYNFTITDPIAPSIEQVIIDTDVPYNETMNVTVRISEPLLASSVDSVMLWFNNGTWYSFSLPRISGDAYDGWYQGFIPEMPYDTFVSVAFWTIDVAGASIWDNNTGAYYTYTVIDPYPPTIGAVNLTSESGDNVFEYWEIAYLEFVDIYEPAGASLISASDAAILSYSLDQIFWSNLSLDWETGTGEWMRYHSANWFAHQNVIPPYDYNDQIFYRVFAQDQAGNWAVSSTQSYTILDLMAPIHVNITELTEIEYSQSVQIQVALNETASTNANGMDYITSGSGLQTVTLNYTNDNWASFTTIAMSRIAGDDYFGVWTATIPAQNYSTTIQYYVSALDMASYRSDSALNSYYVNDTTSSDTIYYSPSNNPITPEYYQSTNISIQISVPYVPQNTTNAAQISAVLLYYQNTSGWYGPYPMVLTTGSNYDGIWNYTVEPQPYTTINFTIEVVDTAGNRGNSSIFSYVVTDSQEPGFGESGEATEYWETARIYVIVFDVPLGGANISSGIDTVLLNWTIDSWGSFTEVEMVRTSGNKWLGVYEADIPPQDYGLTVDYYFFANDTAGNWNDTKAIPRSYSIEDNVNPYIISSSLNEGASTINYNDTVNVTVTVGEPTTPALASGIDSVFLNYTVDSLIWNIVNMTYISGNWKSGRLYNSSWYTIIGENDYGTWVYYYFIVYDSAGNVIDNSAANLNYYVTDEYNPHIGVYTHNDVVVNYYEQPIIHVNITEPTTPTIASGIQNVWLNYSIDGLWQSLISMSLLPNGTIWNGVWQGQIQAQNYASVIEYYFIAQDQAGNIIDNYAQRGTYTVDDEIAPYITSSECNPIEVSYDDVVNVSIIVGDATSPALASGIDTVLLNYTADGTTWNLINMTFIVGDQQNGRIYDSSWYALINAYNYCTTVYYYFIVNDTSGNTFDNYGDGLNYHVTDLTMPNILTVQFNDSNIMYYETVNITIQAVEPLPPTSLANSSGISTVELWYNNSGGWHSVAMIMTAGNRYNGYWSAIIPAQAYGYVYYRIIATDYAGNVNDTGITITNRYLSGDDLPPGIDTPIQSPTSQFINYNQSVSVRVNVTEPIDASQVSSVIVSYYNGSSWINVTASHLAGNEWQGILEAIFSYQFEVAYKIYAIDIAGNGILRDNSSNYYNYTIIDDFTPLYGYPSIDPLTPGAKQATNVTIQFWEPTLASGVNTTIITWWYYKNATYYQAPTNATMTPVGNDLYSFIIPGVEILTTVYYRFFARDNAENWLKWDKNGANWSYFVPDILPPSINNVTYYPTSPEYNQSVTISVHCNDSESGISSVLIAYMINNNYTWFTEYANVWFGSYWNATIGPFPYSDQVAFYVNVTDGAGRKTQDNNSYQYYNFTVVDNYAPYIGSSTTNDPVINYNESVTISVFIWEDNFGAGIDTVLLNYSLNGVWQIPLEMSLNTGTLWASWWSATITPQNQGTIVEYYFIVNDTASNSRDNYADRGSYIVTDEYAPYIISSSLNDTDISYHETVNISVRVQEDIFPTLAAGIDIVLLNYSLDNGATWEAPINMTFFTGTWLSGALYDGYFYALIAPQNYCRTVRFNFIVNDTLGNRRDNEGMNLSYHVGDTIPPEINAYSVSDTFVQFNETVTIHVNITEPTIASGVAHVYLSYNYGAGWVNISMNQLNGTIYNGFWNGTIPAINYGATVEFYFITEDNAGTTGDNFASRDSYIIRDSYSPVLSNFARNPSIVTYDTPANVTIRITEPSVPAFAAGVHTALLNYSVDGVWQTPISMALFSGTNWDGIWRGFIPVQNYSVTVFYYVIANDTAGNRVDNHGSLAQYTVDDTIAPQIITYYLNGTDINYDEWVTVIAQIEEPYSPTLASGIHTILMNYTINDGFTWVGPFTMNFIGGTLIESRTFIGNYSAVIAPYAYLTTVKFYFSVNDTAGNRRNNRLTAYSYTIVDNRTPIIGAYSINDDFVNYNETVIVDVQVSEPTTPALASGVSTVQLSYTTGAGWNNLSMIQLNGSAYNGFWRVTIPTQDYGTIVQFYFTATDVAGNSVDDSATPHQYIVDDQYVPQTLLVLLNGTTINTATISYLDSANITVIVSEPTSASGIFGANLSYSYDGLGWIPVSMNFIAGDGYTNAYYYIIPPQQWNTYHYLKITTADNASNSETISYQYLITDPSPPNISAVTPSSTAPEYNELVLVNVTVTEPAPASGVKQVILQHRNSSEIEWCNVTMNLIGSNLYQGAIIWYAYDSLIYYQILAYDNYGNLAFDNNSGLLYSYIVVDYTPPSISSPVTSTPLSGQPTQINVTVTEPINASGVSSVVLFWQNDSIWYSVQLTMFYGNNNWNGTIPAQTGGLIRYYINATDNANNSHTSIIYQFVIGDGTPPTLISVVYPSSIEYDTPFNITIITTDPSGISSIVLRWWIENIPTIGNPEYHYIDTYIAESGDQYIFTIPGQKWYDLGTLPPHRFFFRIINITDGGSNTLYPTYQQQVTITDNIAPSFNILPVPNPFTNEDGTQPVTVAIEIIEPLLASGVNPSSIQLIYWNSTDPGFKVLTTFQVVGDVYYFSIPGQLPTENVTFSVLTQDNAGNAGASGQTTFSVGLRAERSFGDSKVINLHDLAENNLVNVTIIALAPCAIEILPYSLLSGGVLNPAYQIISGYYQIRTNISSTFIFDLTITIYYSQLLVDSNDRNETTAVIATHNGTGYLEHLADITVNTINNSVTLSHLNDLSYFVVIAKEAAPNPVTNLQSEVLAGAHSIYLTWNSNTELDLSIYNVYRSLSSSFSPSLANFIGNTSNNWYIDTNLVDGQQYFYIVLAVDLSQLKSTFIKRVNGTPFSSINLGEGVRIIGGTTVNLNIAAADMILYFTASGTFDLSVNTLTSSYEFADHKLLMSFYINITTIGSPGDVTGTISLIIDDSLLSGIDIADIAIYYWDGDSWEELSSTYYSTNHTVVATLTHFSIFGVFAPVAKGAFPTWIIIAIAIGAVGGIAIIAISRRKGPFPSDAILEAILERGYVKLDVLAREFGTEVSAIIEFIGEATQRRQLQGFFTTKKKEYITIFKLKEELNKKLEEGV